MTHQTRISGRTAIVFICDSGFLTPTIGAAISARQQVSDPAVEILVFLLDAGADLLDPLRDAVSPHGVAVLSAPMAELARIQASTFPASLHVPVAAMARLWIDAYLDTGIDKFLYLDGDIDIVAPLDLLLATPVPSGGFLAAPDLPLVIAGEWGARARWIKRYLDGLGVASGADYFNSGVLLVDRAGWRDIGNAAATFFAAHVKRCQWHDQSALNAVAGRTRGMLSLHWNYSSPFMGALDPRRIGCAPAIWHFSGFPKPWHGEMPPWPRGFGHSMAVGDQLLRPLGIKQCPPAVKALAEATRDSKRAIWRTKWLFPWRTMTRSHKVRAALQAYL